MVWLQSYSGHGNRILQQVSQAVSGIGIGAAAGFVSGMLGVGGAFVIVPALVGLRRLDQRAAQATALGTTAVATTTAAITYLLTGGVEGVQTHAPAVLTLMVTAPVAAVLAARRLPFVSERMARTVFGVTMLLLVPLVLLVPPHHIVLEGWTQMLVLAAAGVLAGGLSGFLGIGSGLLLVPLLLYVAVDSQVLAQGISLLAIAPTAVVGSAVHWRTGLFQTRVVPILAVGAFIGAVIGARVAHVVDERFLRWLLVCALVVVGVQQLQRNRTTAVVAGVL
jgi:uncharacterized protein